MDNTTRTPAVAGIFYPDNTHELSTMIDQFLQSVKTTGQVPKAIIVPHAGYVYSGPVAASAYALIRPARDKIKRVILLGPSHKIPLLGLATTNPLAWFSYNQCSKFFYSIWRSSYR